MASRVIAAAEPLVVIAITPLLLFPTLRPSWTALGLALLALVWLLRAIARREPWPVTPANLALLLFCLTIPLGVWASAALDMTVPKLMGLILGLAAFRVMAFSGRTPRCRSIALAVFGLAGLGIWTLGLLGSGFSLLNPLAQRLPAALMSVIVGSDQAVNPNILAGGLLGYLPVVVVLAIYLWRSHRKGLGVLFALTGLLIAATLFRTQSRSAVLAAAAGFVVLALLLAWFRSGRRGKRFVAVAAGVLVLAAVVAGAALFSGPLVNETAAAGQAIVLDKQVSLAGRIEIWSRAIYALQDFPITGVGLGTFDHVLHMLYPLLLTPPDTEIGHAHNVFLQVGVDHGLGGLVAYIALLLASAVTAWHAANADRSFNRYLALGLLASLLSLHVHGMTNSLLDAKPAIVLWMLLGLIASFSLDKEGDQVVGQVA